MLERKLIVASFLLTLMCLTALIPLIPSASCTDRASYADLLARASKMRIDVYDASGQNLLYQYVPFTGSRTKVIYFQNTASFASDNLVFGIEDAYNMANADDYLDIVVDMSYWHSGDWEGNYIAWVWFKGNYCKKLLFQHDNGTWMERKFYGVNWTKDYEWHSHRVYTTTDPVTQAQDELVAAVWASPFYYTAPYDWHWKNHNYKDAGSVTYLSIAMEDAYSQSNADNYCDILVIFSVFENLGYTDIYTFATGGYWKSLTYDGSSLLYEIECAGVHQTWYADGVWWEP